MIAALQTARSLSTEEIVQYLNFANIDGSVNQFFNCDKNDQYNCASVVRHVIDTRGYMHSELQNVVLSMFAE